MELPVSCIMLMRPERAKTVVCSSDHTFDGYAYLYKNLCITNNHNPILGSCESHVESTSITQESNPLVLIGTYTGEDDVIFFTSLEGIHTCHLYLLMKNGSGERRKNEQREGGTEEVHSPGIASVAWSH